MSKALLVVNPSSGKEAGKEYASVVASKLKNLYTEVSVKWTEKEGDAEEFSREAAKMDFDAVFALGGDGTVNECVNGIAGEDHRPDFGFIPLGTVNDLGRVLGISMNPEKAIEQMPNMVKRPIDVGRINDGYFVDIVAIGSIPEAVHEVPVEKKSKLGSLAYLLEGAKALGNNESYQFSLELDGTKRELESFLVLIALTNSVAGFQTMIPQASVDDGYMHMLALKGDEIADKISLIPKVFIGEAPQDAHVFYRKFKKGAIAVTDSSKKIISNVDGDEGDYLPLDLEVLHGHIQCFVPGDSE